jgi:5-formyltetrahydrofolate cyclo-ligase
LGYGGGYYDRTLAALSARGPLLSIGLAFRGQELLSLPHEAHDRSLDLIATDEGLLWPEPLAATLKDINF